MPAPDPVHVVHIVPAIFGDCGVFGGAERYAFELARHMAEQTPVTLVAFGDRERRERIGNLDLRVIGRPWYVRGQPSNPIAISMLKELRGADVVHCHQRHLVASSVAALACRLARRPVFVTDLGGGGWDISAYLSTDRWFTGHLHLSEYSRTISGHANQSFAHVILGGVDAEKFSPDESLNRKSAVLYAGRILPHKGLDDLVAAMPPELELQVIGRVADDRFLGDLHRLAEGKRVSFRHDCDDAGLVDAYRRALCVVLPSVYRTRYGDETRMPELLGQTLLEGMACGAPVVCTRVASMPEIVEDGVTGLIVPPNDPGALRDRILWLRANPETALAMGRAGRRRILEAFTWPTVVRRCLEIYRAASA